MSNRLKTAIAQWTHVPSHRSAKDSGQGSMCLVCSHSKYKFKLIIKQNKFINATVNIYSVCARNQAAHIIISYLLHRYTSTVDSQFNRPLFYTLQI